jgi:hypothetical protein
MRWLTNSIERRKKFWKDTLLLFTIEKSSSIAILVKLLSVTSITYVPSAIWKRSRGSGFEINIQELYSIA